MSKARAQKLWAPFREGLGAKLADAAKTRREREQQRGLSLEWTMIEYAQALPVLRDVERDSFERLQRDPSGNALAKVEGDTLA